MAMAAIFSRRIPRAFNSYSASLSYLLNSRFILPTKSYTVSSSSSSSPPRDINVKLVENVGRKHSKLGFGGTSYKCKFPRPETVPWKKDLASTIHLTGYVGKPVELKYTKEGKPFASTSLAVKLNSKAQETTWFQLNFWEELAEIAAEHLKASDKVYVSGCLHFQKAAVEDDLPPFFQVSVNKLNFVKPSPFSTQEDVNMDASLQNQDSQVNMNASLQSEDLEAQNLKFAISRRRTQVDTASTEKLWKEFFANPTKWWDNRNNKKKSNAPDFKHKDTGEVLWIGSSNPSWVKSKLETLGEGRTPKVDDSNENLWKDFFANPTKWWDNKNKKKNPKAPDFKHKDTGEALWIESFTNPSWVKSKLETLGEGMTPKVDASKENLWKDFFANPTKWWDNRNQKKNPKAPDFKHKDTGEALWIENSCDSSWVKSRLEILDKKKNFSQQSTRPQKFPSSLQDRYMEDF